MASNDKRIYFPSTFASLISTIQERAYVETCDIPGRQMATKIYSLLSTGQWPPMIKEEMRTIGQEKGKLAPTIQGRAVLEFLIGKFNDLFEYSFTACMESRLDLIGDGGQEWKQILRDVWSSYKERYENAKTDVVAVAATRRAAATAAAAAEEPLAGVQWENLPVFRRKGPYGFYVACLGGKLKVSIAENDNAEQILEKIRAKSGEGAGGGQREGVFGEWT